MKYIDISAIPSIPTVINTYGLKAVEKVYNTFPLGKGHPGNHSINWRVLDPLKEDILLDFMEGMTSEEVAEDVGLTMEELERCSQRIAYKLQKVLAA